MNTRKICAFALAAACMLGMLGCTNGARPSPADPVTLNMWHNYGGDMQKTMDALIDEFNGTVGREKGIVINVTAISSSSELNESLSMIENGDPGAPTMPDICTAYPNVAMPFEKKGMLADLTRYFTNDELNAYVTAFVDEGRFDGGLYVFPIAKSTEIVYLNQTLFDEFAAAVPGVDAKKLSTLEGICELSIKYYDYTDALTPDVANDGKAFYAADSWFNVAQVGMAQAGASIFDANNALSLANETYAGIFAPLYEAAAKGGIAIYDGYSSDLSKTGDLVCSTGSSAGVLFYGDTITYDDGTVKDVEYSILPYPVLDGAKAVAIQRGGGLMVAKSEEKKEYAAAEFIKWLTAPAQNIRFVESTGYLPVTKLAFTDEMPTAIENAADARIKKMLTAVLSMYDEYEFFTAPVFDGFDARSKGYAANFKAAMQKCRERYLTDGTCGDAADAIATLAD